MNKKGFLLAEETLKIVLAVIAIGLLAYLLASLYFNATTSQKLKQAEETLPFIMNEIKAGRESIDVYNPKDWWILSGNGELCVCKDDEYNSCKKEGICEKSDFVVETKIKIEEPPITLNINYNTKKISLKQ